MQEVSSSDRADFSLGEESCHGDGSNPFLDYAAVVMRSAKQPPSASAAAKEQGAQRRGAVCCTILGEQNVQILTRGYAVTELKLDSLAFLNDIADCESAGLLIRPD